MKVRYRLLVGFLMILTASCSFDAEPEGIFISSLTFDFNEEPHDWEYGFSDYPAAREDSMHYQLKYAYTEKPYGLSEGKAVMLSGNNRGSGLFMFLKRKIIGLKPNAYYSVTYNVEFASNAIKNSTGLGPSPGDSVYVKVGASELEPKSVIRSGKFEMNIDKGDYEQGGRDMITIGDIASIKDNDEYVLVLRSNSTPYNNLVEVQTNSDGELWLIVGTDSGYTGITTLYYTKINAVLSSTK